MPFLSTEIIIHFLPYFILSLLKEFKPQTRNKARSSIFLNKFHACRVYYTLLLRGNERDIFKKRRKILSFSSDSTVSFTKAITMIFFCNRFSRKIVLIFLKFEEQFRRNYESQRKMYITWPVWETLRSWIRNKDWQKIAARLLLTSKYFA